jgi:hypothetical protein
MRDGCDGAPLALRQLRDQLPVGERSLPFMRGMITVPAKRAQTGGFSEATR